MANNIAILTLLLIVCSGWSFLRHFDKTKRHRSFFQSVILAFYTVVRFGYALVRGLDIGYLEYRKTLLETPPVVENELVFGPLLGEGCAPTGLQLARQAIEP